MRYPMVKAYVLIKMSTGDVGEAARMIKRIKGVREVCVTFGPYDAVAELEGGCLNDIARTVACQIQPVPGVAQTLTCVAAHTELEGMSNQPEGLTRTE